MLIEEILKDHKCKFNKLYTVHNYVLVPKTSTYVDEKCIILPFILTKNW